MSCQHSSDESSGTYLPACEFLDALAGTSPTSGVLGEALRMASQVIAIIDEYDVENLTLEEMDRLCRRLCLVGAINTHEYGVMAFREELCEGYDTESAWFRRLSDDRTVRRNWPAIWADRLRDLQARRIAGPDTRLTEQIADLLQSFVAGDEDPSTDA